MANPLRGEVAFEALGARRVLVLDTNALIAVQAAMGYGFEPEDHIKFFKRLAAHFAGLSLHDWRLLLFHGLQRHDATITLEGAGDILDAIGVEQTTAILAKAIEWAFPNIKEKAEDPKATGATSPASPGPGSASS